MSHARKPIIGTEPPEAPGRSVVETVEALQRRVVGDLDELLGSPDHARGAARSETPD